ncbi:MAG TPA: hypothetical protein GX505_05300 [Clostridiales bacterium]|nr:hypothetical protein [Clostridiales bacterium]
MNSLIRVIKSVDLDLKENFITFPFYIISRPFKGFSELKYENRGKHYFAYVMMVLMCLFSIMNELYRGFVLSGGYYVENKTVNTPYVILMTLAPVALFVTANWCVTAITDGNGKMIDIFMVYAYAAYPKLLLSIIGLLVSNIVAVDEAAFASFFYSFGSVAFAFYLFIGLIVIHEYTFTKSIIMIILTIAAMSIIVFVIALFLSLSNEVIVFLRTVLKEVTLRL